MKPHRFLGPAFFSISLTRKKGTDAPGRFVDRPPSGCRLSCSGRDRASWGSCILCEVRACDRNGQVTMRPRMDDRRTTEDRNEEKARHHAGSALLATVLLVPAAQARNTPNPLITPDPPGCFGNLNATFNHESGIRAHGKDSKGPASTSGTGRGSKKPANSLGLSSAAQTESNHRHEGPLLRRGSLDVHPPISAHIERPDTR